MEDGFLNSSMSKFVPVRLQKKPPKPTKRPQSLSKLKKVLWELCKQITRKTYRRADGNWNCYTTGILLDEPGKCHTGHFIAKSICSTELAYDLKNLRIQSYRANIHLSGDTLQFEENLIRDHGQEYVDELKRRNRETKGKSFGMSWYLEKIEEYKKILVENSPTS